ncbi:hypothetical protein BaRGS_00015749 [Batillaria attramentaria]|uniref:Uncharacterized protein n=1 Tax=Batillaria attramentaria TaxID=370345 RepID=A0ABD0L0J2_9CAEN
MHTHTDKNSQAPLFPLHSITKPVSLALSSVQQQRYNPSAFPLSRAQKKGTKKQQQNTVLPHAQVQKKKSARKKNRGEGTRTHSRSALLRSQTG